MMLFLAIVFFPSLLLAAQVEPVLNKVVVTTGAKDFPKGETVNAPFLVPDKNIGVYKLSIACDPKVSVTVTLVDAVSGTMFGRIVGGTGFCHGPESSAIFYRKDADNNLVPIPKSTMLQTRVSTEIPTKKDIQLEVLTTP